MKFTKQQQQVIDTRNKNLLVSAAAGSGKTMVLVERICKMLEDKTAPMDVDELLVVTFTEAAAAEMKARLLKNLRQRAMENPSDVNLQKQLSLVHQASITTIHGFCLSFLREHFYLTELEPGFRIIDKNEQQLLIEDVMDRVLTEFYSREDETFLTFVDNYAEGRNDGKLAELVKKLYSKAISMPWPKQWLNQCKEMYGNENKEEFLRLPLIRELQEDCGNKLDDAIALLEMAQQETKEYKTLDKFTNYILVELQRLQDIKAEETFEIFYDKMASYKMEKLPVQRKLEPLEAEARTRGKLYRDAAKKILDELKAAYYFQPFFKLYEDFYSMKDMAGCLCDVTAAFYEEFAKEKRKRNVVDFSDLEHLTLEVLYDEPGKVSKAGEQFKSHYKEIMIDEYQDSNALQEAIICAIEGGKNRHNRFMVGDVKQSIYGFRQADPELFVDKYDSYAYEEGENIKIDLDCNFRSRNQILSFSNQVFDALMQKNLGKIVYDSHASLKYGADYNRDFEELYRPEILLFDRKDSDEDKEIAEARIIGEKVREWMDKGQVTQKDGTIRAPKYGDIVILLRAKAMAPAIAKELEKMSIPVVTMEKTGYFATTEVNCVLSFLQLVDNARQDIPLYCVLNSPVVGLTNNDLVRIKTAGEFSSFYEAVMEARNGEMQDNIKAKLEGFFAMLEKFQHYAAYRPIHELIQLFYEETGYVQYVKMLPGGELKEMNLTILVERARAYESTSYHGLFHFLRYIRKLKEYNMELSEGSPDAGKDAVHIMTIHKSKGLEFPVVFVAGLGRGFNKQESKEALLTGGKEGIVLRYTDAKKRVKRETVLFNAMKNKLLKDQLAEELRVLYVALTRAKEKLYVTGSVRDYEKMEEKFDSLVLGDKLTYSGKLKAKNFLELILPALYKRQIYLSSSVEMKLYEETGKPEAVSIDQLEDSLKMNRFFKEPIHTPEEQERLNALFSGEYAYEKELLLPVKMSVSDIKHHFMEEMVNWEEKEEEDVKNIVFQGANQGALRGSAMHRALECLDFAAIKTSENKARNLEKQLDEIGNAGLMDREERELLSTKKLLGFFDSELFEEMAAAAMEGRLKKEQPFVMSILPKVAGIPVETEDEILVQGIMDAFYETGDGMVLVDYKTDKVKCGEELIVRYKKQMELYGEALSRNLNKPVKKMVLYSFALEKGFVLGSCSVV